MRRKSVYAGGVRIANRYSGNVKVACSYDDSASQYVCRLSVNGRHVGSQWVGAPASSRLAVDSPAAFDNTARAALSFATNDGMIDESDVDYGPNDINIRRRK